MQTLDALKPALHTYGTSAACLVVAHQSCMALVLTLGVFAKFVLNCIHGKVKRPQSTLMTIQQ